jgi:hypothetical protein
MNKGATMTTKNKGRDPKAQPKESEHTDYITGDDPFLGWFALAKPSRTRQQKRGWNRRARR